VRIVGKLFLAAVLCAHFFSCFGASTTPSITLRVLSADSVPIKQVGAGVPFILEVSMYNIYRTRKPDIKGIEDFYTGQSGFQMKTINGKSNIKYTYNMRIDKTGTYKIGPAQIREKGKKVTSDVLSVVVGEKQIFKNGVGQTKKTLSNVMLRMSCDKKNVVVGQKVRCFLRFYYMDDADVTLDRILTSEVDDLRQTEKKGAFKGKKTIKNNLYHYLEWRWNVYPEKEGEIIIPAHRADFSIREDNGFLGLSSFFRFGYEKKHVFSNALKLTIDPLPEHDKPVHAVGDFVHFSASVDRAVAKQGDGIVLTLELEGDADLKNLDISELQNMPESLRYYDSKNYIVDKDADLKYKKKRFEFIVQGMETGELEVSKQEFTYFDPKRRKFKTLTTSPIMVNILPPSVSKTSILRQASAVAKAMADRQDEDDILPLDKKGRWHSTGERKINFWLFMLLALIPFFAFGFLRAKKWFNALLLKYTPHILRKNAFNRASKRLKQAKRKKDFASLYGIFITFFSERFTLKENAVSQDSVVKILQKHDFSEEELNNWRQFFNMVSSYMFYDKDKSRKLDPKMFDESIGWIEKLRNKL